MQWLLLSMAILAETLATTALKASDGFTRLGASLACIVGYGVSFYLLSLALRALPVGVAYAIWSGVGVVLISAIGVVVFEQSLDGPAMAGIGLIVAGVAVLNLFSATTVH